MTTETRPEPEAIADGLDTNALLSRVLDRLDALEAKVDKITLAADAAPALLAATTDTVDDLARQARARGIDVDARLTAGVRLLEQVSAPARVEALAKILDRTELLAEGAEQMATLPNLVAMLSDIADNWVAARQKEGVDLDRTLAGLGELARVLSKPEVMKAVGVLSERLPELAKMAEDLPKLAAMGMDALDELSYRAAQSGFDVDQGIRSLLTVGLRLTEVLDSPHFKALLDSDVLAPEALEVIGRAGRALAEQSAADCGRTGAFGAIGATADADIQRTLYFALGFARRFGQRMSCAPGFQEKQLPSSRD